MHLTFCLVGDISVSFFWFISICNVREQGTDHCSATKVSGSHIRVKVVLHTAQTAVNHLQKLGSPVQFQPSLPDFVRVLPNCPDVQQKRFELIFNSKLAFPVHLYGHDNVARFFVLACNTIAAGIAPHGSAAQLLV